MEIKLRGHRLQLLAQRGVYWPDENTLLVADTHFGKETTFRRGGIPVPVGSTGATLDRIQSMLDQYNPSRLCFLGDLFHNRASLSDDVVDLVENFFRQNEGRQFILVLGNHDVHLGGSAQLQRLESLGVTVVDQLTVGNVGFMHDPAQWPSGRGDANQPSEPAGRTLAEQKSGTVDSSATDSFSRPTRDRHEAISLVLCGHLHPAIQPRSLCDAAGKLPCFWYSRRRLVLPAIGTFTGTHRIKPAAGDHVWVIAGDQVIAFGKTTAGRTDRLGAT